MYVVMHIFTNAFILAWKAYNIPELYPSYISQQNFMVCIHTTKFTYKLRHEEMHITVRFNLDSPSGTSSEYFQMQAVSRGSKFAKEPFDLLTLLLRVYSSLEVSSFVLEVFACL